MPRLPRVFSVVAPILRAEFPDCQVVSWVPNVGHRKFPLIQLRRSGGVRHRSEPTLLGTPIVELTAHSKDGLPEAEEIYEDVLEVLYDVVRRQIVTPAGYLHSIFERSGSTQVSSPFQDAWAVQGLVQFGVRPPRTRVLLSPAA